MVNRRRACGCHYKNSKSTNEYQYSAPPITLKNKNALTSTHKDAEQQKNVKLHAVNVKECAIVPSGQQNTNESSAMTKVQVRMKEVQNQKKGKFKVPLSKYATKEVNSNKLYPAEFLTPLSSFCIVITDKTTESGKLNIENIEHHLNKYTNFIKVKSNNSNLICEGLQFVKFQICHSMYHLQEKTANQTPLQLLMVF